MQILQSQTSGHALGAFNGSASSGANNLATNCAAQHSVVRITERLTISGSIMGPLINRAL
jgi:hypothetical protein